MKEVLDGHKDEGKWLWNTTQEYTGSQIASKFDLFQAPNWKNYRVNKCERKE